MTFFLVSHLSWFFFSVCVLLVTEFFSLCFTCYWHFLLVFYLLLTFFPCVLLVIDPSFLCFTCYWPFLLVSRVLASFSPFELPVIEFPSSSAFCYQVSLLLYHLLSSFCPFVPPVIKFLSFCANCYRVFLFVCLLLSSFSPLVSLVVEFLSFCATATLHRVCLCVHVSLVLCVPPVKGFLSGVVLALVYGRTRDSKMKVPSVNTPVSHNKVIKLSKRTVSYGVDWKWLSCQVTREELVRNLSPVNHKGLHQG